MHDFKAFVREHLTSIALPPERELKVVDELAAQLEDTYESALARGLTETSLIQDAELGALVAELRASRASP